MTWHMDIETDTLIGATRVHQLLRDDTHELLAEVDYRGNVLYADAQALPMLSLLLSRSAA